MPPDTPEAPEESKSRSKYVENQTAMSDGVSDCGNQTTPEIPPDNTREKHAQNKDSGGSGGLGGISSNTLEKSAADPKLNHDKADNSL